MNLLSRWRARRKMKRAVRRANSILGPLRASRRREVEQRCAMLASLRWYADRIDREMAEMRNNIVCLQLKQRITLN